MNITTDSPDFNSTSAKTVVYIVSYPSHSLLLYSPYFDTFPCCHVIGLFNTSMDNSDYSSIPAFSAPVHIYAYEFIGIYGSSFLSSKYTLLLYVNSSS